MKLPKVLKKLTENHMVLCTVLVSVALIYFINNYSSGKSVVNEGNKNKDQLGEGSNVGGGEGSNVGCGEQPVNSGKGCDNSNYKATGAPNHRFASAAGMETNKHGLPSSCNKQGNVDPSQLLPSGGNNAFSSMNPSCGGDIKDISLLKAGHHIGINTIGNSLRNPNLQIRSEPANPMVKVSPWMQSTITPDTMRKSLEAECRQ